MVQVFFVIFVKLKKMNKDTKYFWMGVASSLLASVIFVVFYENIKNNFIKKDKNEKD